jgi:hypothetical protein
MRIITCVALVAAFSGNIRATQAEDAAGKLIRCYPGTKEELFQAVMDGRLEVAYAYLCLQNMETYFHWRARNGIDVRTSFEKYRDPDGPLYPQNSPDEIASGYWISTIRRYWNTRKSEEYALTPHPSRLFNIIHLFFPNSGIPNPIDRKTIENFDCDKHLNVIHVTQREISAGWRLSGNIRAATWADSYVTLQKLEDRNETSRPVTNADIISAAKELASEQRQIINLILRNAERTYRQNQNDVNWYLRSREAKLIKQCRAEAQLVERLEGRAPAVPQDLRERCSQFTMLALAVARVITSALHVAKLDQNRKLEENWQCFYRAVEMARAGDLDTIERHLPTGWAQVITSKKDPVTAVRLALAEFGGL